MTEDRLTRWLPLVFVAAGMLATTASAVWHDATDNHVTANQVAILTTQADDLSKMLHELSLRLGAMPRPDEVAEEKHRMSRAETAFGQIIDRLGRDEATSAALDARVHSLESPFFRQVR